MLQASFRSRSIARSGFHSGAHSGSGAVQSLLRSFVRPAICAMTIIAAAIAMSGCENGKNDNPAVDNSYAVAPLSEPTQACANGTTYQGRGWNRLPYAQHNIVPYGHGVSNYHAGRNNFASQGFRSCQPGTVPMCDGQYGLVCMPRHVLGGRDVALWQYGQGGAWAFAGFNQGYTAYGNIYNQVGQTCTVGFNTCGYGAFCRPMGPATNIGYCAR